MPTERQLQILEERRNRREECEPNTTNKVPLAIEGSRFPSFQFQKSFTVQDPNANYFYINGVPVWLSQVTSQDFNVNQDHTIRTSSSLWDCGVILAKYLEKHPDLVYKKRVIELGAGKALPAIAAAALGARVVITDAEEGIAVAENVADLNDLQINGRGPGWVESVQSLDWINR
jgi:2-polyprenyl-3-methyl-5-hydroxy-6-metoxy-1,4-benzoquinol methylase